MTPPAGVHWPRTSMLPVIHRSWPTDVNAASSICTVTSHTGVLGELAWFAQSCAALRAWKSFWMRANSSCVRGMGDVVERRPLLLRLLPRHRRAVDEHRRLLARHRRRRGEQVIARLPLAEDRAEVGVAAGAAVLAGVARGAQLGDELLALAV